MNVYIVNIDVDMDDSKILAESLNGIIINVSSYATEHAIKEYIISEYGVAPEDEEFIIVEKLNDFIESVNDGVAPLATTFVAHVICNK